MKKEYNDPDFQIIKFSLDKDVLGPSTEPTITPEETISENVEDWD